MAFRYLLLRVRLPPGHGFRQLCVVCFYVEVSAWSRSLFEKSPTYNYIILYIYNVISVKHNKILFKVNAKIFVFLAQYFAGYKIKKNEMGWACGASGSGEGCV